MNEKKEHQDENAESVVEGVEENIEINTENTTDEKSKKHKKSDKKQHAMKEENDALKMRIKELEDGLLREKAEIENFKRRMKQEYETNLKFSNQVLIENLLPVLDSFDRALTGTENASPEVKNFVKGVTMIQDLFEQVLTSEGLEIIPTVDQQFDPYIHQAVLKELDEEKEDNIILDELQKGYRLKDRVLRASMVKVNSKE